MKLFEQINEIIGKDYYKNDSEINLNLTSLKIYSECYKLPEQFIREHYFGSDLIKLIIDNQILSEDFIEEILTCNNNLWNKIISRQKLSKEFIEKHTDILQKWRNYLSHYQILSWDFMEKYEDKLNWSLISRHQPFINLRKLEELKEFKNFEYYLYKVQNENVLNKKYNKNKDWFVGYVYKEDLCKNIKTIVYGVENNTYNYNRYTSMVKVKIYWDDLITTCTTGKVEQVRRVKSIT